MTITGAIYEGYIPSNLLAKDLGIEPKDLKDTTLEKVVFKKVTLIKIPLSVIKFISSSEYTPTLLLKNESESKYDYILQISAKRRVGFWK
jgi:hypothetical protein